ncbi:MAG: phage integrase family protein [Mycobacterium sp.]|nr:phage integrase family protein [Mycobacterium sp.]
MASIKKLPNGMWRARYRDDYGKEHAKHEARKADAQAWLDEKTSELLAGTHVDPKAGLITFRAYFDQWSVRQVWVRGTLDAMTLTARSVPFADLPMRTIRRSHVEAWIKKMDADGLAASTVGVRYNNLRTTFRAAKADKVIGSDPTEGLTLPRQRRAEAAMNIPTPEEVGKLLAAAEVWFKPYIALCAFAGLRQGEAAAVKLDDIDFLRRKLTLSRQVQRVPGAAVGATREFRAPKFGSERVIFLPEGLVLMLSEHARTVGVSGDDGWLFVGPPLKTTVHRWWRKSVVGAGLSDIRMHDLRHFFASGLIANGCDVVTVQRAMGHSNATTTLATYSHLWPTAEERISKASEALMESCAEILADAARTEATEAGSDLHGNRRMHHQRRTVRTRRRSKIPGAPTSVLWRACFSRMSDMST